MSFQNLNNCIHTTNIGKAQKTQFPGFGLRLATVTCKCAQHYLFIFHWRWATAQDQRVDIMTN